MKKHLSCGICVLMALITSMSIAYGTSAPHLNFTSSKIDFGVIKAKEIQKIPVGFEFSNTGDIPLVIIKTVPSCDCMRANYPKKPIAPGHKATLMVDINTDGLKGKFNKTVIVKSNADNNVAVIRLVGEIK